MLCIYFGKHHLNKLLSITITHQQNLVSSISCWLATERMSIDKPAYLISLLDVSLDSTELLDLLCMRTHEVHNARLSFNCYQVLPRRLDRLI